MTMSKKILFSFITSKKLWLLELDLTLQEIPFVNEEAKELIIFRHLFAVEIRRIYQN